EGLDGAAQGEGEDGVADRLTTGAVVTEDLAEESPQAQGGAPQGAGEVAKGDPVLGEALLELFGVEDVGQRQGVAVQERPAGVVALESLGWNPGEWHGSPPCLVFKQGRSARKAPGKSLCSVRASKSR